MAAMMDFEKISGKMILLSGLGDDKLFILPTFQCW
jgi:hypothetical protein